MSYTPTFIGLTGLPFTGIRITVTGHNFSRTYERQFMAGTPAITIPERSITPDSFVIDLGEHAPIHVVSLMSNTEYIVSVAVVELGVVIGGLHQAVLTKPPVGYLPYAQPLMTLHRHVGGGSIRVVRSINPVPYFK